jgi:WD40 repeat protein
MALRSNRLRLLRHERSSSTNAHARKLIQCLTGNVLERIKSMLGKVPHTPEELLEMLTPYIGATLEPEDSLRVLKMISLDGTITWDSFMDFVVHTSSQVGVRDSITTDAVRKTFVGSVQLTHSIKPIKCPLSNVLAAADTITMMKSYPDTQRILLVINKRNVRVGMRSSDGSIALDPLLQWAQREGVNALEYVPSSHQVAIATNASSLVLLGLSSRKQVVSRVITCNVSQTSILCLPRMPHVLTGATDGHITLWKLGVGLQPSLTIMKSTQTSFSGSITFLRTFTSSSTLFACSNGQIGIIRNHDLSVVQYTSIATRLVELCVHSTFGWVVTADDCGIIRAFQCADDKVAFHVPVVLQDRMEERSPIVGLSCEQSEGGGVTVTVLHKDMRARIWDLDARQYVEVPMPDASDSKRPSIGYVVPEKDGFLFGILHSDAYRLFKRPASAKARNGSLSSSHGSVCGVFYDSVDGHVLTVHPTGYCQWSLRTGLLIQSSLNMSDLETSEEITTSAFDSETRYLYFGTTTGSIHACNITSAAIVRSHTDLHTSPISQIVLAGTGVMISHDVEGKVGVTTPRTQEASSAPYTLVQSGEGRRLCDAKKDATLVGNKVYVHRKVHTTLTSQTLTHCFFLPGSDLVCGVNNDSRFHLFDWVRSQRQAHTIASWPHGVVTVTSVAFHSGRNILYVGDDDGTITTYDVAAWIDQGEGAPSPTDAPPRSAWKAHDECEINHITILENENIVLTTGADHTVKVWSLTGKALGQLGTNRSTPYLVDVDETFVEEPPAASARRRSAGIRVTRQLCDLPPRAESAVPLSKFFLTDGGLPLIPSIAPKSKLVVGMGATKPKRRATMV